MGAQGCETTRRGSVVGGRRCRAHLEKKDWLGGRVTRMNRAETTGVEDRAGGAQGENMRRAGDLTLIKRFVRGEDDGRDTRLGACLAERYVP